MATSRLGGDGKRGLGGDSDAKRRFEGDDRNELECHGEIKRASRRW